MSASFHCRKRWTRGTVGYGVQSVHNKYIKVGTNSPQLWCGAPRYETKKLALFLRKSKRYRTELQKRVSIVYISSTSKLSGRHNILTGWCLTTLCHCCTAVFRPKTFKLLHRESRPDSLAYTLARFDSTWIIFMKISENFVFCEPSTTIE